MAYSLKRVALSIGTVVVATGIGASVYFGDDVMSSIGYTSIPGPVLEAKSGDLSCKLPKDTIRLDDQVDYLVETDGGGVPTSLKPIRGWKQPVKEGNPCEPELGSNYIK